VRLLAKHLIATAALLLAAAFAAAAPAAARDLHIGLDADTSTLGAAEQDHVLDTGAGWLRERLDWRRVEPADDSWDWSWSDAWFASAAERGLRVLPVLGAPPCWAVPRSARRGRCRRAFPASEAEFAEYVAAVVARYGPGGAFWSSDPALDGGLAPRWFEIWDEPYRRHGRHGTVDPGRYGQLFSAASVAGRAQHPAARFLIASARDVFDTSSSRWVNWADAVVDAVPGIGADVDGIAVHPFPGAKAPTTPPADGRDASFENTGAIWADWAAQGVVKPVWITAVGYSSCDDGAVACVPGATQSDREAQKATWLGEILDTLSSDDYAYVHAVFVHELRQWRDISLPTADPADWFGLIDPDGAPLPAWGLFADAVAEHDGLPVADTTITSQTLGSGTASFSFAANDPTATFECRLDGGPWTPCTSPASYGGLAAGSHSFRVRAVNALATETTPAISVWIG
jgi:hypothetical protein